MFDPSESSDSGCDRDGIGITTLFIKPVAGKVGSILRLLSFKKLVRLPVLTRDEVLSHFSAFGEVQNVSIRTEKKSSNGII